MGLGNIIHKIVHYDGDPVVIHKKTDLHGTFYSPKEGEVNDVGIVLCHGLTLFRKLFEPMAKVIRDRGFDVLTMTFRGHGWRRKGKLTLERALKDVKHCVRFMQNPGEDSNCRAHKKIILVGHSLGALMSLRASLCKSVKENIIGLVLVGCPIKLADYKLRSASIFGGAKFLANVDVSEILKHLKDFDALKDIKKVKIPTIMVYGKLDEILLLYQKNPKLLEAQIKKKNKVVEFKSIGGMFHTPINLLHSIGVKTSVETCYTLIADWIEGHANSSE
jgi:alpha-beta hydrolase superfamily lysophospholipase